VLAWLIGVIIVFIVASIILLSNPLLIVFLVFAVGAYFAFRRRGGGSRVIVVQGGSQASREAKRQGGRVEVKLVSVKPDLGALREVKASFKVLTPASGYPVAFIAKGLRLTAVSGVALPVDVSLDEVKAGLSRFEGFRIVCGDKGVTALLSCEAGLRGREEAAGKARDLASHVALTFNGRVLTAEELEAFLTSPF